MEARTPQLFGRNLTRPVIPVAKLGHTLFGNIEGYDR
jgi:hypothetical protein